MESRVEAIGAKFILLMVIMNRAWDLISSIDQWNESGLLFLYMLPSSFFFSCGRTDAGCREWHHHESSLV